MGSQMTLFCIQPFHPNPIILKVGLLSECSWERRHPCLPASYGANFRASRCLASPAGKDACAPRFSLCQFGISRLQASYSLLQFFF